MFTSIARYFLNPISKKNSLVVESPGVPVVCNLLYILARDLLFFNLWLPNSTTVGVHFPLQVTSSKMESRAIVIKFVKDIKRN